MTSILSLRSISLEWLGLIYESMSMAMFGGISVEHGKLRMSMFGEAKSVGSNSYTRPDWNNFVDKWQAKIDMNFPLLTTVMLP